MIIPYLLSLHIPLFLSLSPQLSLSDYLPHSLLFSIFSLSLSLPPLLTHIYFTWFTLVSSSLLSFFLFLHFYSLSLHSLFLFSIHFYSLLSLFSSFLLSETAGSWREHRACPQHPKSHSNRMQQAQKFLKWVRRPRNFILFYKERQR